MGLTPIKRCVPVSAEECFSETWSQQQEEEDSAVFSAESAAKNEQVVFTSVPETNKRASVKDKGGDALFLIHNDGRVCTAASGLSVKPEDNAHTQSCNKYEKI